MTKEDAKKFLYSIADDLGFTGVESYTCKDGDKMRDAIKTLEQEQRWISCSKELPKESGFYLVSTTDCITIMEFCKGWISQNLGSCNWYVKAWQPLPEPYKEMDSEQLLNYADQDTMKPAT